MDFFYHNNIIPWPKVGLLHMYLRLFSYQLEASHFLNGTAPETNTEIEDLPLRTPRISGLYLRS